MDRPGAKAPGFNSPFAQHIQRLISRAFTYSMVGSLAFSLGPNNLSSFPSCAFEFNCGKGYVHTLCPSSLSFHGGKLVPAICRGNNEYCDGDVVDSNLYKCNGALVTRVELITLPARHR